MKQEKLQKILEAHKKWINNEDGGARADLRGADLRGADLRGADLRRADLRRADLSDAYLSGADLRRADLSGANLRGADLRGADLDFSCWPLWCGSLAVKVCKRIAVQLAYHFCKLDCDDPEYIAARNAILDFANQFHRVDECGKLEKR
nr:MAG TPA_asm: pentapeptide repeat protein [Caudoviricetes sp.]